MKIRNALKEDAKALLGIYSYYVENTAITFEYDVPSEEEFIQRIEHITEKYPYIICENDDGMIMGYAYAGVFKDRAAYDHCVEVTVYVRNGFQKHGIGRILYSELEKRLKQQGIINFYACIGYPCENDDEYLTKNSAEYHEHMGYRLCGTFHKCGYKFGRWYDMIWMEKFINIHE